MRTAITIERDSAGGRYEDVVDVAEYLGRGPCGSIPNAIRVMCEESETFRNALEIVRAERDQQEADPPAQ